MPLDLLPQGLDVNGRTYDSGKGEIRMGTTAAPIKKIDFGDKLNKELLRRIGSQEVEASTDGEYEPEDVNVEVELAVWKKTIFPRLPANGYGNYEFQMSVNFTDDLIGTTKIKLLRCTIKGEKDAVEAGPGAVMKTLVIQALQVVRDGKTLNRRKGTNIAALTDTMTL